MSRKPSVAERAHMATTYAKNGIESAATLSPPAQPSTSPGSMAAHLARESQVFSENHALKEELKTWEGSRPTRPLDPGIIGPSRWANRHELSFDTPEFASLKSEIDEAGGNVQPIKVRPLPVANAQGPAYEIVFGHRRHRACLELGLAVNAIIEPMADQDLFIQMDRENRNRQDLSPWELGEMYKRALDQGLYPSAKKMAAALGVDAGYLGRAVTLARLPQQVIAAFASPLDLQFAWAAPLRNACEANSPAVLGKAALIAQNRAGMSPVQIMAALTAPANPATPARQAGPTPEHPALAEQFQAQAQAHEQDKAHAPMLLTEPLSEPAQASAAQAGALVSTPVPEVPEAHIAPSKAVTRTFSAKGKPAGSMRVEPSGEVSIKVKAQLTAQDQERLVLLLAGFLDTLG